MRFSSTQPAAPAGRQGLNSLGVAFALALVLSAGVTSGSAEAAFDFTFTVEKAIKTGPTGLEFVKVDCIVENTGTELDSYDILRPLEELPGDFWTTSICTGGEDGFLTNGQLGGCQANFVDSLYAGTPPCGFPSCAGPSNLSLQPGQTDTVSAYFTPDGPEGSGYCLLDVQSVGDPSLRLRLELGCVSDGVDLLLVDDAEGEAIATFYQVAVPPVLTQGTWRRQIAKVSGDDLSNFPAVIWFTGTSTSTLDLDDRAGLQTYLTAGGQLFLSGQDIAYDLNDPASPNRTQATVDWYENNLRSRYVSDDSGSFTVVGVANDPVTNGLALAIQGGDGANNQTDPDKVEALVGGGGVWSYGVEELRLGGVRWLDSGHRGVNFPFGFEAIASASERATVMERILQWFLDSPVAVGDAGAAPGAFALEEARPNPFNPSTHIAFTLSEAGTARLRILDATGRTVRILAQGELPAGRQEFHWDGRDGAGRAVSSGVYVAELSVDGRGSKQTKLSLIR